MFRHNDDVKLLFIDKWMEIEPSLRVGFTTKNGGVSRGDFSTNNLGLHVSDNPQDVLTNRNVLSSHLTIPLEKWIAGEQVHKNSVQIVDFKDAGKGSTSVDSALKEIDGLITNSKGILCTAFFADCVPLYFFDPVTGYIGIAHAGWKGTVGKIAEEMVRNFKELGSKLDDLFVAIGPCISKDNYEVDEYVKDQIQEEYRTQVLTPLGNKHYLLDLKQLNVEILVQSGVFRSNIDITNYCTFRDKELFFSHRRDNGKTGRMLGFIGYSR
ncbi:peptidoglycan editing factor PgeF [Ornithinibacillus scapharcae]|uniref:peptidoglycan editing factor PgeF n=1 Tax=Ornithinibacillus scapharcae TaxID=1147159 RepID=UPI001ED9132D|nr:peptidoglycan editing factor PgeF [Ornithinibacillus scapharcae]